MRDLINKITTLTEAVGLANRKPGETFTNDAGDMLTFLGLTFYPESGKFDNPADMTALLAQIEKKQKVKIEWINKHNAGTKAFGLAEFIDSNNNKRLFGKYFTSISSIYTANNWPNSALPDGFHFSAAKATKMKSGLMPQDVLTDLEGQTPDQILSQVVAKFGKKHPLVDLTYGLVKGQQLPIYIETSNHPDISFSGFRDYFCEILQPIAMINGLTTGNAQEAEQAFLGKKGFKDCKITFDTGKNTGLFDSLLIDSQHREVKISTKGGMGAFASVTNLTDAIDDLTLGGNTDLIDQYSEVIDLVRLVGKQGQSKAPLALAEHFGMISGKESALVNAMRENPKSKLTANLQALYDDKISRAKDLDRIIPYYVMLSALAERVSTYVNENTDFSQAAADILNHSALIQVYTDAKQDGTKFILERFRAVYPSNVVAGVEFSYGKTYYNTGIKGNFTFKVLKKGEKPTPTTSDTDDVETDILAPTVATGGRNKIRPKGAAEIRTSIKPGLGRERR